ncbi:hypothetical protein LUZ61_001294 [Rhynchospora tenuis]|uniref:Cytochrome P450 monooxygenase n=1 Tax=Rhynchospora tenuis TaxID=198213 RepID=A0AAD5ZH51_9POAL|nr:hypothetical protein LUZ61_001294 [Rhynchospora tenuis]
MDTSFSNPTTLLATAVAALLIFLLIKRRLLFRSSKKRNYPPVAGTIFHMLFNLHRITEYQTSLSRKYKTFRILTPFGNYVFTVDPDNVEYILKTNFSNYGNDLLMKFSLDSILKVGFGVELGVLSGLEEGKAFSKAFEEASCQIVYRFVDIFWKVKRFLNIGSESKMKKNIQLLDDFVYGVINKKSKQLAEQGQEMEKEDILSRFLLEKEKSSSNIDDKYLRDIILNFILAGRDTTAVTLSWFFYILCKHPHAQDTIAREVQAAIKTQDGEGKAKIDIFMDYFTEEAINSMQYLHAALTETLRLYPAIPLDGKWCFSDDTLPDGFDVNKGDVVYYQPYPMGRMKFLWGDDADDFRPERWLNNDGIFVPQSPFKFTAFQAGPRICLGKEFAYRQMKIVAATLLYFFKFQLWDSSREVKIKTTMTLQIDGGLHLHAMHR